MATQQSSISFTRRHYREEVQRHPFRKLPFVKRQGDNQRDWAVKPTKDYDDACGKGMEYAAHFAQYLADNPNDVGGNILGPIVQDMARCGGLFDQATHGYAVGFFSFLEELIALAAEQIDVFAVARKIYESGFEEGEAELYKAEAYEAEVHQKAEELLRLARQEVACQASEESKPYQQAAISDDHDYL